MFSAGIVSAWIQKLGASEFVQDKPRGVITGSKRRTGDWLAQRGNLFVGASLDLILIYLVKNQ